MNPKGSWVEVEIGVREELEASADVVWKQFEDWGRVEAWSPSTVMLDVQGEGVGAVRRFTDVEALKAQIARA